MLKKLLQHSALYAIAPRIASFANIVVLPFTTSKLTELDYGVYATIGVYVGLLGAWRQLGLNVIASNVYYKHQRSYKLVWGNLLGFYLVWGVFYALILIGLMFLIIPSEASDNFNTIAALLVIPIILFQPFTQMANLFFQFEKNPKMIAIPTVISGISSVAITFYTIYVLEMGYMGWYVSAFFAELLGLVFYFFFFYIKEKLIPIFRFSVRTFKYYLSISLPVIPHTYAGFLLNSSDRLVMDVLGIPTNAIGQYSFAYTFGNYAKQISQGVNKASVPYYLDMWRDKASGYKEKIRSMTFNILLLSITVSSVVCLWLKEVFTLLISNPDLEVLYPMSIIIVMSYNFNPMYQSVMLVFQYHEKTNMLWRFSFVAGAMNVILNFIFIPIYGVIAATFTTLISLMCLGFLGIFFSTFKKIQPFNYYPVHWMLSICLMLAVAFFMKDETPLIKGVITIAILGTSWFVKRSPKFGVTSVKGT